MAGDLHDGEELDVKHEINVTPFIDVMLVLLIVFMIAAPLSTVDVEVELPVAVAKAKPRPNKPIFISIKADNSWAIGEDVVAKSSLIQRIDIATQVNRDTRLYIRADKSIPYGEFMLLMNKLRVAGYLKVGLVGLEGAAAPEGDERGVPSSVGTEQPSEK